MHPKPWVRLGPLLAVLAIALLLLPAAASAEFIETDPTVLCKTAVAKCEAGQRYPSGTTIEASLKSGTKFILKAGFVNVECTASTLSGKANAEYGAPLSLEVSTLSMSGCVGCKAGEFQNLPYGASAEQSTGNNAAVSLKSSGKGAPKTKASSCVLSQSCTYGASAVGLTLEGGSPATLVAKEALLERQEGSTGLCAEVGKLNATYEVTTPKPIYASRFPEETLLCKEFANPCPSASVLPKGASIEGKLIGEARFAYWIYTATCTESAMSAGTTAEAGNPLPGEISFVTFGKCEICKSVKFRPPYPISVEPTSNGNGTMKMASPIVELSGCPLGGSCYYESREGPFELIGGNFPEFIAKELIFARIAPSTGNCGEIMKMNGRWQSATKNPVWVARMKA